jgi:hypothetical protein
MLVRRATSQREGSRSETQPEMDKKPQQKD